jgi:hypothetical protein
VAIGPLLDAYLPAMPRCRPFHVRIVRVNNTISISSATGRQFFGGAFSDRSAGNAWGYSACRSSARIVAIAFSTTADEVQWLRFVRASAAVFHVICWRSCDVYHVDELGRRMAIVTLVMLASP